MTWGRDPLIRQEDEKSKEDKEAKKDKTASEAREMVRALGRMTIGGGGEHVEDSERP